jgi:hypothetical protein
MVGVGGGDGAMSGLKVTVSGRRGEADMELAVGAPLATVLAAPAWSYAGVGVDDVVVVVAGQGRLDVSRSLAECGVGPGAVLNLFPRDKLPVRQAPQTNGAVGANASAVVAPAEPGALADRPSAAPKVAQHSRVRRLRRPPATDGPKVGLWAWQGAHGGAGVTTLIQALGGLEASDATAGSLPRVVVTRTHAAGLRRAQRLGVELDAAEMAGGAPVLGLVLVPDAPGRLPPALRDLAHVVAGGYSRWWVLDWSVELRLGPYRLDSLPRRVRRLGEELQALVRRQAADQHQEAEQRRVR